MSALAIPGIIIAALCVKSSQLIKTRWVLVFGLMAISVTTYTDLALLSAGQRPGTSELDKPKLEEAPSPWGVRGISRSDPTESN